VDTVEKRLAMNYRIRVGTARQRVTAPAGSKLHRLSYREGDDDGRMLVHIGDFSPHCGDCGEGTLQRAPLSQSRQHRICDQCGSHWHLHRLEYVLRRQAEERIEIDLGCFRGGIREPDRSEHVNGEGSPTHGELLGLLQPHHLSDAIARANGGLAHIEACWARRERFYPPAPRRMP
jgi:hypothetical protein